MRRTWPLIVLLAPVSCSSLDGRLYGPGEPPRLKDGSVLLRTWPVRGDEDQVELREVRARDGRITVEYRGLDGARRVGEADPDDWASLWDRIFEARPFADDRYRVEPDDPEGGWYHVVTVALGGRTASFSAQHRTDLLIFTSREVRHRLTIANAIVRFVRRHATVTAEPAGEPGAGKEDAGRTGG